MHIKRIKVSNFKSFGEIDIELGDFNVLIGANASGKSNFVEVFRFLRNIANHGLENAVSMQGGAEYLSNLNIGSKRSCKIEITSTKKFDEYGDYIDDKESFISLERIDYTVEITSNKNLQFEVQNVKVVLYVTVRKNIGKGKTDVAKGKVILPGKNSPVEWSSNNDNITTEDIKKFFSITDKYNRTPVFSQSIYIESKIKEVINEINIYEFDPNIARKAIPLSVEANLRDDGSNLAIVLKNILAERDKRRKLINIVRYLLPNINDFNVENFTNHYILKMQETYFKDKLLPSSLMSQGTIDITALIVALYFEKGKLTIIEEPERNIHPHLISKVVEMMKEVSQNKQLIITTQHPEVVKYAGEENLLLVTRDKEGYSQISKPADKERVRRFLENEIGISDLYVDDLLGD